MSPPAFLRAKIFGGYVSSSELLSWLALTLCYFYALLLFTLPREISVAEKFLLCSFSLIIFLVHFRPTEKKSHYSKTLQAVGGFPWAVFLYVSEGNFGLIFLHLAILPACYFKIKTELGFHFLPKSLKIFLAIVCVLTVLHTLSCTWILIYPNAGEDYVTSYVKALYWLISTLTTIGYGDITPTTTGGRIFTIFVMILGATSFGILIASFARMMAASDKRTELKNDKLRSLAELFKHYEIPKVIQNQAVGFCHHLYSQKIFADEEAVLQELPAPLRAEFEIYMNIKPISKITIFKLCTVDCLKNIAQKLTQEFFEPGQKIIQNGDMGHEMFLIGHGTVNVFIDQQKVATLEHGQCFGEVALIQDTPRTADVIAESYCSIFKLSRESFNQTILQFPDLKKNVDEIIQARKLNPNSAGGNLRQRRRNLGPVNK